MPDPSSPGGPMGAPGPDEARAANDQLDRAGVSPPNTAWSTPEAGWDAPRPQAGWGPPPPPGTRWQSGPSWEGSARRPHRFSRVAASMLLVATAAFVGVAISHDFRQLNAATTSQTQPVGGSVSGAPSDVTSIVSVVDPALVDINVTLGYQSGQAAATGIVLNPSGLVLTNNHVVDGATAISATDVGNGQTVNTAGKVIAMDTATSVGYSFSSAESQGFAVPVNTAMAIVTQIQNHTSSATVHIGATAFLGVELESTGSQGNFGFGGQSGSSSSGATVTGVLSGSPAAQAGLTAGDTIVSVDGQTVDSPTTLSALLGQPHPGDHVQIGWTDASGGQHTSTVQLATGPAA
jgi:S1-C subfamily serine protease